MGQPAWMVEAWQKLGTREVPGKRHSRDVIDFFRDAGRGDIARDEVPWCAAFVGACLKRAGKDGTGSLLARSYLDWGVTLARPKLGAIVVLSRGKNPNAGHVGFWVGETSASYILIGGNQSNSVSVEAFAKDRLLGFRWPAEPGSRPAIVDSAAALAFARALEHVLEMEGGFTDDPDDPGGPTNKGIILEVYCRHAGLALNSETRARRVAELRSISDDVVEEIYRQRYWKPSRAGDMSAAIGLMHFDASVNQGLTGAARLLQRAAARQTSGLEIDGEIGPLTMAAVNGAREAQLLADYANARRSKYRSLRHFWKFGRGWLNRVDHTEALALGVIADTSPNTNSTKASTKGSGMTKDARGGKWWGSSMTIWGAVLTALSTVVPVLGPAIGLDVTPDAVREVGDQFITAVQAIGGLFGTIMTIYGRARATEKLERRHMQVHI